MSLNDTLHSIMLNIPDCIASGVVNIPTGKLLGASTSTEESEGILELIAAATLDLFQQENASEIESLMQKRKGIKNAENNHFKEIIVFGEDLLHIFIRFQNLTSHVVVFVTKKSANLGLVLAKSRMVIPKIEAAL